jgi:hypothetical protein
MVISNLFEWEEQEMRNDVECKNKVLDKAEPLTEWVIFVLDVISHTETTDLVQALGLLLWSDFDKSEILIKCLRTFRKN